MEKGNLIIQEVCPYCGDCRDMTDNDDGTFRCHMCGKDFLHNPEDNTPGDIRDSMSDESKKLYKENNIFRRSIDCGNNKGISYEKTLEVTCLAFAEIMKAQNEKVIELMLSDS